MAYATVDELAAALRVRVTPENTPGLQACLDAAAIEIDHEVAAPDAVWVEAGYKFTVSTVVADPGSGRVALNHANPPAATVVSISNLDAAGADQAGLLAQLAADDLLELAEPAPGGSHVYVLTAAAAPQAGWVSLAVDLAASSAPPPTFTELEALELTFARPTSPADDPLANRVNIVRAVEWYKSNDSAFGLIGFDQTGALQAPRDGFNRHAYALTPLKRQWGIA